MLTRQILSLLLILTLPCGAALGEVYRWVDEDGRVHYTDKPPAGQGEEVKIAPAPPQAPPPASRPDDVPDRQRLLQMYERERQERKAVKAQQERRDAQLKRDCERTEHDLRRYIAGGVLFDILPSGERRYYSPDEKDQELQRLRGLLDRYCDGVPKDLQARKGR